MMFGFYVTAPSWRDHAYNLNINSLLVTKYKILVTERGDFSCINNKIGLSPYLFSNYTIFGILYK